jgi:uncharacterized membrane protein YcaP (DUF421 family)
MAAFDAVDWNAVFVPKVPVLEIVVRGTIVYLALFTLIRVVLQRQAGTLSVTDLLVIVLIADAIQNAMSGDYKSVPEGLVLVSTIVFWSYALDWLGTRFPLIGRFVHPPPLDLVRDGKMLRRNMRKELVTTEELMSQLREQGVNDLRSVERARMEGDGHISVVKRDKKPHPRAKTQAD